MTDPVAEVLGEHRAEYERRAYPSWACSCGNWDGAANDDGGPPDGSRDTIEHHEAHVSAALREAGLIPEVRERITERLISGHGKTPEEIARGMTRVVTTYADHVTEWEAVD